MPYIHFSDEQKLRANSVDLVEFLHRQGEKLIPSGRDRRLASDHSITVRGNEWFDHASEEGGHSISFVQNFYGLSFPEAVTRLLNGERGEIYPAAQAKKQEEKKPFALPPANENMRRVYAYLIKKRLITPDVLNWFVSKKLIYESREKSKDQTKEYRNAVFVGVDENGVPRHAHKRGLHSEGPSFRYNVDSSDPRYSFHHVGTSDRLYVLEAPIDMLSLISLYPLNWQEHSYVALCGTAEHAMLWMLEQYPHLQRVALCLDHDEAGIEAIGRLTEILRENGHEQAVPLLPEYKDWNEDLKAKYGLPAEPAEEHPQLVAAAPVCQRLGELSAAAKPERLSQKLPALLSQYRTHLHWGRFEEAMGCMEKMAALSMAAALREQRQIGNEVTGAQAAEALCRRILPHQNRGKLQNRTDQIAMQLQSLLAIGNASGVRSRAQKEELTGALMDFALCCAKVQVRYAADQYKQQQKEAARQELAMQ